MSAAAVRHAPPSSTRYSVATEITYSPASMPQEAVTASVPVPQTGRCTPTALMGAGVDLVALDRRGVLGQGLDAHLRSLTWPVWPVSVFRPAS